MTNVIESFRFEAKKKFIDLNFYFDITPQVGKTFYFKTDPEKLKLIISNLLSNAIKFSFEKQKIDIRVWLDDAKLKISVEDFGTGISEDNQKKIFDRFKRLDSGINSINRGHGLGLSINKAILDLLNGSIEIQSEIGKGSKFSFEIPEAKSDIAGFSTDGNEFLFDEEEIF